MAEKRNFTLAYLTNLKPPTKGRLWVYDTGQPGLAFMVTSPSKRYPNGKKSYYVYKRAKGGDPVRVQLNDFKLISLDDAREAALDELKVLRQGINRNAVKRKERERIAAEPGVTTLADAWEHYLKNHLEPHKRPATIRESKRIWEKHLKDGLGSMAVQEITSSDVAALHIKIGQANGEVMANRVFEFLRRVIYFAINCEAWNCKGIVNPCRRKIVTQYDESDGRERVLNKEESKRLSDALANEQDGDLVDFLTLLAETGQRRNTVAMARWNQIDLTGGRWIVPNWQTKNRKTMTVFLTKPALKILKRRATEAEPDAEFVFAKRHFQRGWERVREAAGLPDVWFHDFRRTLGTNLALRGENPSVIKKVLGHADIQMVERYVQIADEEAKKALDSVSGGIIGKPSSKRGGKEKKTA